MFYFIGIGQNVDIYSSKRLQKLSVLKIDDLNQADSDLDDIEDFVEADTNQDGYTLKQPEPGRCRRKQIRICRHKLQTRAYPRTTEKKARQSTECNLEPETQDLQQEWLQLIQVEKESFRIGKKITQVYIYNPWETGTIYINCERPVFLLPGVNVFCICFLRYRFKLFKLREVGKKRGGTRS